MSDPVAEWRAAKVGEWNTPGSKLRKKHPTSELFHAWMNRQCERAVARKRERNVHDHFSFHTNLQVNQPH